MYFPSREKAAPHSRNLVFNHGRGGWSRLFIQMSRLVSGVYSMYARMFPSGDHESGTRAIPVIISSSEPEATDFKTTSATDPFCRRNVTCFPSGVQRGDSFAPAFVNRIRLP